MIESARRSPALAWIFGVGAAAALALVGCGGAAKPGPAVDPDTIPWETTTESPLDRQTPLAGPGGAPAAEDSTGALPEDAVDAPADSARAPRPRDEAPAPAETEARVPDPRSFVAGWRVQLAAYSSLVDADVRAREARAKFTEPVYVEYEPPFYKVRVGDFLGRPEAESMATRARAEGYQGAWVVDTLVLKETP
jgi:cell division septation protein DedD